MKLALAILLCCVPLQAQSHRFLDRANVALHAVAVSGMVADIVSSHEALKQPGTRESNPLARSQGALIGLKVGGEAAAILVSYGLHRTGHHRAERIVPMLLGGPSWIAAVHNFSE